MPPLEGFWRGRHADGTRSPSAGGKPPETWSPGAEEGSSHRRPPGPFFPTKPGEGVSGHPVGSGPRILQVLSALSQGDGGPDHSNTTAGTPPPWGTPAPHCPWCLLPQEGGPDLGEVRGTAPLRMGRPPTHRERASAFQ